MCLTRKEMPVLTIARNRKKKIPNLEIKQFDIDAVYDTKLPKLTSYELLGQFLVLDDFAVREIEENRKNETIPLTKMIGKKVILICDELIEIILSQSL